MEKKLVKESDEIEIVNVEEKPLTNVRLLLNFYRNLEQFSNQVPVEKTKFVEFVKANFTCYYDDRLINTVWKKLRHSCKPDSVDEPISLSSSDEDTEADIKRPKLDESLLNRSSNNFTEIQTPKHNTVTTVVNGSGKTKTNNKYVTVKDISLLVDSERAVNNDKKAKRKSNKTSIKKSTEKSKNKVKRKTKMTDKSKEIKINLEPEELRRKLLIDKLIEVTLLPSIGKVKKKKHSISPNKLI